MASQGRGAAGHQGSGSHATGPDGAGPHGAGPHGGAGGGPGALTAEDRSLIAELLARYAEAIDAGDFDAVGDLLADATVRDQHGNVVARGRDEVVALYSATTRRHDDGTPCTAHVITNVIVEPRGPGAAAVRSRFTVLQATDSLPLQPVVVGRYRDRVERIGGAWRFVERTMVPERWGEVGEHLHFDPRDLGG